MKGGQHAHGAEVAELVDANAYLTSVIHYSHPANSDEIGERYDKAGRLNAQTLLDLNAGDGAHYMLCGPPAFMADVTKGLIAAGVPAQQVHFETFGPTR